MLKANFYILISLFKKKTCLLVGFFCFFAVGIYGQNQIIADSLESIYNSGRFEEKDRLQILYNLAKDNADLEKSLQYSNELLIRAKATDSTKRIIGAYMEQGSAFRLKGDLSKALESFFEGVKIAKEKERKRDLGLLYSGIAIVYSIMGDDQNTILNYKNAISILKEENDSTGYADAMENLGNYNFELGRPDSALVFFKQSGKIYKALDYKKGIAYNLGNIGLSYALKGENDIAEKNIGQATAMLEELGDYYPICVYLTYMSDIYAERGDWGAAFGFAHKSLNLANQHNLKEQISDAYLKLSELYEKRGNTKESLKYYQNHIAFRDSVTNIGMVQEIANQRVAQKQIEVDLLNEQKRNQKIIFIAMIIIAGLTIILLLTLYWYYRAISKEKKISENLLHNILPYETAEELKEYGKVQAKKFDSVTVLFTDFKDFTRYSASLTPENLVRSVDYYFSKFDEIFRKHGLEKIKTIGDAYMCVGGLHYHKDHALKMVLAALEINEFVVDSKKLSSKNETRFDMRIGINTGAVVAGVVGIEKFAYDIWGDTVNVASRMQSNSAPGKINISENTYELIKDTFDCEYRGEVEVKNKGMMKMYYVNNTKDKTN